MPPERPTTPPPSEQSPHLEGSPSFYYEAARYPTEPLSALAYFAIQEIIFQAQNEADLSAYRFLLENIWNVAVLGRQPAEEVQQQIHQKLEKGDLTALPDWVLQGLVQRRAQQTNLGTWVEGHHRPGIVIPKSPPNEPPQPRYRRKPKKR